MDTKQFDEKAKMALRMLMEKFWVLRAEEPELYQQIREREMVLKRYLMEKFGFELIVHQHFIKLEKLPVETKSWMGMQHFKTPLDYALFCCALAFTESRTVDEQFLLSEICEDIKDTYPGDFPIDWTNYNHRKSLVRVIQQLEALSILRVVEGKIETFSLDEEQEVLYEVTIYARYFMRSLPEDLPAYLTPEEILAAGRDQYDAETRRRRVYRKLFISPVVYREEEEDADFAYIRNYRNRLREDIEEHTMFRFEIFKNAAMLVSEENKQELTLFPDQKAIMDVAMHFAAYLRDHALIYPPDPLGRIHLSPVSMANVLTEVHKLYGKGWSKQYREGTISSITEELLDLLENWEMLTQEELTANYVIMPLVGRFIGFYPEEFPSNG